MSTISKSLPMLSGRVLFVDDDQPIVRLMTHVFNEIGCQAKICTNATEALELFSQDPGSFDLVLTDQSMPNTSGIELARNILAIRPDIPVLLLSGHSNLINRKEEINQAGITDIVTKPITITELTQTLSRFLPPANPTSSRDKCED